MRDSSRETRGPVKRDRAEERERRTERQRKEIEG
jgi:hypothetical protein